MKLICILALVLLVSLSSGLELSISGSAIGIGHNETIIECSGCNITTNGTNWTIEGPTHDIFTEGK